jgi:hypothetical protein
MGGSAPKAPDYPAQAKAQGEANVDAARVSSKLSNPNVVTPYGSQTVTYGDSAFDQAGYDNAMRNYQTNLESPMSVPNRDDFSQNYSTNTFDQSGYDTAMSDYNKNAAERARLEGNPPDHTWTRSQVASRGQQLAGLQDIAAPSRDTFSDTTQNTGFDQKGYNDAMQRYQDGLPPLAPSRGDFIGTGTGGDEDIPTVRQTLSPANQALYEQELRVNAGLGDIAEGGVNTIDSMLGTPFDMSSVPAAAQAGQAGWDRAYNAQIERNRPFQERQRDRTINQLSNQGIFAGSEAYQEAMRDLQRGETDFNLAAQGNATQQQQAQFGMDEKARQNAITQQSYLRQLPLNELNALRMGNQIQNPQFQGFQGQNVSPAPIMQAANAQYAAALDRTNAQNASSGNMMSGLFGLGSAGIGAYGMAAMSDERLKENIVPIAQTPGGNKVYSYNFLWDKTPQIGVMAQEVEHIPGAVIEHPSGYKMVDYSKVI